MKKWQKPQILSLSVENTYEGEIELGLGEDHYCHKTGEFETHIDNKETGHYRGNKCDEVHWNGSKDSKCCCKGTPPIS